MEELQKEIQKNKFDLSKLILPGSILIAAVLISGTLFYTSFSKNGSAGNAAQVGQAAGNNGTVKVADVKIGDSPVLGSRDAKVSIIEFADFRCPFCERFFKDSESQIIKNYVETGKANFVFKQYAFLGQTSTWAAEAAECANEQGKFWQYHDWLYNNQAPESNTAYYSKANLIKYAGQVGLNKNQFSSCLNSDKYLERVNADLAEGQAIGVNGTPSTFINGRLVTSSDGRSAGAAPFAVFKAIIEKELKSK